MSSAASDVRAVLKYRIWLETKGVYFQDQISPLDMAMIMRELGREVVHKRFPSMAAQ